MFFAACEGYSDKLDDYKSISRRIALIIHRGFGGKLSERQLLPLRGENKGPENVKVWGSKEEYEEMRAAIMKAHKITLS